MMKLILAYALIVSFLNNASAFSILHKKGFYHGKVHPSNVAPRSNVRPILMTTAQSAPSETIDANNVTASDDEREVPEELSETEKLMKQVKDAGLAGVISYAAWELAFWTLSVPVCVLGYKEVTGHWPDFSNQEDMGKLGAEAFAFVNFARFAVPLRIGLALGTTQWIQENIVDRYMKQEEENVCLEDTTEASKEDLENIEEEIDGSLEATSQDEGGESDEPKRKGIVGRIRNLGNGIFARTRNLGNRILRR